MTTDWKECIIGDICNSVSETYKGNDEQVVLINTSDVLEGAILNHSKVDNKNLKGQFKKTFKKNDILYSEIRPANKRFAFVNIEDTHNYIASTKLMVIRPDIDKVLPEYLYMLLKSQSLIDELQHLAETRSGTFPQITFSSELSQMEINLPPLETQQKIARVLGAIDDKIELNNSINKNLEQQAQHYFDEIVSKATELSYIAIGDICDVKGGKRLPKGINLVTTPNSHPYIRVRDLNDICVAQLNSNYEYVDDETQKTISRYTVSSKDVIISIVGTIGLTAIVGKTLDNANLTENCVKLTNIKTVTSEYILLFLRSKEGQEAIKQNTVGAVQAKLPIKNIQSMKVPVINNDDINKYLEAIFNTIAHNIIENERLTQLRDTLLPKLMNGEIDVDKVEV